MALFDGYFDPQQFGEGGGLLARLRAVQPLMGQDQAGAGFGQQLSVPQSPTSSAALPGFPNYDQLAPSLQRDAQNLPAQSSGVVAFGPHPLISDSDQGDVQKVGITSDQSSYCKTMRNICIQECDHTLYGIDTFGPHRACIRTCMHNAGCLDF
jgi:hypothetical protein